MALNLNDGTQDVYLTKDMAIAALALQELRSHLTTDQDVPQVDKTANRLPNDVETVNGAHCPMSILAKEPKTPAIPQKKTEKRKMTQQSSQSTYRPPRKKHKMSVVSNLNLDGNEDCSGLSTLSHSWQLNQIKCSAQTVGTGVRQSWRWVPDVGNPHFKHQLLAEADKSPTGNIYDPNNFQVDLAHIDSIWWAKETLKVDIVFHDSGELRENLLLEFRYERNRDQFLDFCCTKNIYLYRTDADIIQSGWEVYESRGFIGATRLWGTPV